MKITLISVNYEVLGKVQGVFFQNFTQAEGKRLGLVGWVQNTEHSSVQRQLQGPMSRIQEMQQWLQKKGSPKSHIKHAEFHNERKLAQLEHNDFCIVK
uniref:acylphosphatase n=1 Tax=Geotrypetes seraphini TaxID=260995 RepID=A0A6P8Q735_GEOSA|nr:acylphosphatase-1-like [Geotrypetes seraphini]